jgi:hypothetical protein
VHRRIVAGFVLAAGLAQAAGAQQQTPENAKAFLIRVLPGSGRTSDPVRLDGATMSTSGANGTEPHVQTIGAYVDTPGVCRMQFSLGASRSFYIGGQRRYLSADVQRMDFSNINEIIASKNVVTLTNPNWNGLKLMLFISSEEMATRVAFAMNFLKARCNSIDRTGF